MWISYENISINTGHEQLTVLFRMSMICLQTFDHSIWDCHIKGCRKPFKFSSYRNNYLVREELFRSQVVFSTVSLWIWFLFWWIHQSLTDITISMHTLKSMHKPTTLKSYLISQCCLIDLCITSVIKIIIY